MCFRFQKAPAEQNGIWFYSDRFQAWKLQLLGVTGGIVGFLSEMPPNAYVYSPGISRKLFNPVAGS